MCKTTILLHNPVWLTPKEPVVVDTQQLKGKEWGEKQQVSQRRAVIVTTAEPKSKNTVTD